MNESTWVLVAQLPLSLDLLPLRRQFDERGIVHEVVASGSVQAVWIEDAAQITIADQLLKRFNKPVSSDPWSRYNQATPRAVLSNNGHSPGGSAGPGYGHKFKQLFATFPITIAAIGLSVLGWLVVVMERYFQLGLLPELFFLSPDYLLASNEYWRLLTPIFLHFGELHLIFNALWLWILGSRIESRSGGKSLLTVIMFAALVSNFAQFIWHSATPFGGMSGVVYGLLGYLWIRAKFDPDPRLFLPPALMGMMLFFLLLGMTGILNFFAGGGIANAAHIGGLLAGMAMGFFAGLKYRPGKS